MPMPWSTPMHIEATAYRNPVRRNCRAAVKTSRAPLIPSGCPSAIAPNGGLPFRCRPEDLAHESRPAPAPAPQTLRCVPARRYPLSAIDKPIDVVVFFHQRIHERQPSVESYAFANLGIM